MATEDDLFNQIQSFQPSELSPEVASQFAEREAAVKEAQAKVDRYNQLSALLSGASQGLTFGWADEAVAGLSSLFGSSSYADEIAQQEQMRREIMRTEPGIALGTEIAAGLGTGLAGAAVKAPGLASRLLLGASGKTPLTLGQLATIGASQGAIAGAGTAEQGEKLIGGILGAGTGAALGGALGKFAQKGAEEIATPLYTAGALGGAERGSLSLGGKAAYTAEELRLAKLLSEAPPETLQTAAQNLMRAGELGKPVFIPEAAQSPSLFQEAKFIANYPASIEIAKNAIEQRAADATNRITQTLDLINSERNVTAGANKLVEGAKSLLEELGAARKEATRGLYETAFEKTPQLTDSGSLEFISTNPRVQQAIKSVRKELPELATLPDSSIEILHQAQQYLAGKARAVSNKYTAGKIKDARDSLMTAIKKESPDYEKATTIFSQMSKGLTAKEQSKIGFLANVSPDKPGTIGRVFALDSDLIASLRQDFIAADKLDEWEAGVRSYLQRAVETAQDERNPITKMIGSPSLRAKLEAALGDKYEKIIEPLTTEQTMLQGQRQYLAGSPTAPLGQREEAVTEGIGAISKAMKFTQNPIKEGGKMLAALLGGNKKTEFYENYAKLLFSDPEKGLETLNKITTLTGAIRKGKDVGQKAAGVVSGEAGRGATSTLKAVEESKTPTSKLAMTGVGLSEVAAAQNTDIDSLFNQIQNYSNESIETQEVTAPEAKSGSKQKIGLGPSQEISTLLNEVPQKYNVNPKWVRAIAQVESSFDPDAIGPKTRFGRAEGLTQLMPATAKALGVKNPFDPKQAIEGASKLLSQLENRYGKYDDERLLFAAYNSRPATLNSAIRKAQLKGKAITWENIAEYMPVETQNYVRKVTKLIQA